MIGGDVDVDQDGNDGDCDDIDDDDIDAVCHFAIGRDALVNILANNGYAIFVGFWGRGRNYLIVYGSRRPRLRHFNELYVIICEFSNWCFMDFS
jgi:hypothetical protein